MKELKEKTAILMSGPAGAGKSTWAKKFVESHSNVAILSTDEIRYQLFGTYSPTENSQVEVIREIMRRVAEYSEKNVSVIIDTAVTRNRNRLKWGRRLRTYYKNVELVIVDTPVETCLKQNDQRARHVPELVIRDMCQNKEDPSPEVEECFNKIIVVKHE